MIWQKKLCIPQMMKNQIAEDVITAMEVYLTAINFADRNTDGMDIRERSGRNDRREGSYGIRFN